MTTVQTETKSNSVNHQRMPPLPGTNEWYGKTLPTLNELPSKIPDRIDITELYGSWPDSVKKLPPLPTMYDLPSENPEDPGMPDLYHPKQAELLSQTFQPPDYPFEERLVATDLHLYYDMLHPTWYKRPDWFAVLDVPALYYNDDIRLSYVRWQERVDPYIVVELLSPSTRDEDLGKRPRRSPEHPPTKWEVYEQILRIPYYIVFDRHSDTLQVFQLAGGSYQQATLPDNRLWIPALKIGLGVWQGDFQGLDRLWIRWYDQQDRWILADAEKAQIERQRAESATQQAEQERQRADQERQRAESATQQAEQERQRANQERQRAESATQQAEQERQRAEQLAAQLSALGIEPNL